MSNMLLEDFVLKFNSAVTDYENRLSLSINIVEIHGEKLFEVVLCGPLYLASALLMNNLYITNFIAIGHSVSKAISTLAQTINLSNRPSGNILIKDQTVSDLSLIPELKLFPKSRQCYYTYKYTFLGRGVTLPDNKTIAFNCFPAEFTTDLEHKELGENEIKFALVGGKINKIQ